MDMFIEHCISRRYLDKICHFLEKCTSLLNLSFLVPWSSPSQWGEVQVWVEELPLGVII